MFSLTFFCNVADCFLLMTAVLQVQVLAEFGDLPQNVDLIVLQQLPVSTELNFLEVPIASHAFHLIHHFLTFFVSRRTIARCDLACVPYVLTESHMPSQNCSCLAPHPSV